MRFTGDFGLFNKWAYHNIKSLASYLSKRDWSTLTVSELDSLFFAYWYNNVR